MTKSSLELSKGDWIVHSRHGLGQVTGTDTKALAGVSQDFYVVRTESITYWLPKGELDSERIRPVANNEAFSEALEILSQAPKRLDENFRRRLADIHDRVQACSLKTKAALIRDMYARDVEKDVHVNERKILDTLQDQFINEWVAACGIDPETAMDQLRKALNLSSANLKRKKSHF